MTSETTTDAMTDGARCQICGAGTTMEAPAWHEDPTLVIIVRRCHDCGLVRIENNEWDYDELGYSENSTVGPRVGTPDRPGRELHMASLAVDLIERHDLDVLVLGAGLSYDWQHIAGLPDVGRVYVSDFDNLTDAPNFVAVGDASRTYDVVIACEVIEHIGDPMTELGAVFDLVSPGGVFVGSTNLYDGTPLPRHWYPFIPGHLSYHTGESLRRVAASRGAMIDFRVPLVATQRAGRRKRYVIVTRDRQVLTNAAIWFAGRPYGPSEDDQREFVPHGA